VRRLVLVLSLVLPVWIAGAASTPLEPALVLEDPPGVFGGQYNGAVAASGSQILVGASGYDPQNAAAYIYDATDGRLIRALASPLSSPYVSGARSVGFSGNIIIVGGPTLAPEGCCAAGEAIDLFDQASGRHLRTIPQPTTDFGGFAQSVAGVGGRVLTGAPEDFSFPGFGRGGIAYLFDGATGELDRVIENPNPEARAKFGMTVAATRDALFVAAPFDDTGGVDAGVVYAFDPSGEKVLRVFHNPDPARIHHFGAALSVRGTKLLIGAPDLGPWPFDGREAAYLFDLKSGELLHAFASPVGRIGGFFGFSVALVGSKAAIGAFGSFPDSVFVFDGESGELLQTLAYTLPPPEHSYPLFATAVAAAGRSLVVAAPGAGKALLFARACGDGKVTAGERCDDGNRTAGDGCSAACRLETCGDGAVDPGEECDDGNCLDGDGCDTNCTVTRCGNGVASAGEACDDGNSTSGDGCDENCTVSACGNGVVAYYESCDDGNRVGGDGCSAWCSVESCGNQIVDAGESCESADGAGDDYCDAQCRLKPPIWTPFVSVTLAFDDHRACTDCDDTGVLARVGSHVAVGMGGEPRGSALLFDLATGNPLRIFEPPPPYGGNTYGRALAVVGENFLVGEPSFDAGDGGSGVVHVFDPELGAHLRTIRSPRSDDRGFGASIATLGTDALVAGTIEAVVYLIDPDTGGLVRTFLDLPPRAQYSPYALAALGTDVLVGGDGAVYLLDGLTGVRRHTFGDGTDPSFGHTLAVLDGDVLIGGTGAIRRYDGTTGEFVRTYPGYQRPLAAANGEILAIGPPCPESSGPGGYLIDAETGDKRDFPCVAAERVYDPIFAGALVGDTVVIGKITTFAYQPAFWTFAPCTDGVLVPGEECDDGNAVPGDGCEPNCRLPRTATSTTTTLASPPTTTSTAPVVPGPSCAEVSGVPGLRCVLDEAFAACAGVDLPERVVRRLERARTSLRRAVESIGSKRARRILAGVARHLSRAGRVAERAGARGAIPRGCATALGDTVRTARGLASTTR
jgi:cysteine-rich repeat protein